jgi:hypothetical protein
MHFRFPAIAFVLIFSLLPAAARDDLDWLKEPDKLNLTLTVQDPDKWIENTVHQISEGKTGELVTGYRPNNSSLSNELRGLSKWGRPVFIEKVRDVRYGTLLREVIYLALYNDTDYVYFRFIIKKNKGGWLISDFWFKTELTHLFPEFVP